MEFLGGSALRFDFDLADRPQFRTHEFANNATVVIQNSFDDSGLLESQDISDPRFYPRVAGEEGEYNPNILNQYGMISGVALSYDDNGNLTSDGKATYTYDALNRLTAAQGSQNATYLYDALDRRAAKVVGGQATWYLYDGLRAVGEYDGAGGELRRFVYGAWIDEPVCMANATDRYFYHHNRLGTVAALADSAGALAEAYRYTPFGGVETASALGNPYHFTGRRLDEETGLYYYRARAYDPALGRFLQPDPIGISGGVNLYRYVGNVPTAYVDPLGLINFGAVGQGALAMFGGATAVFFSIPTGASGAGLFISIPLAIGGSVSFSWGASQFIAGWLDSSIPFPKPSYPFLSTLLFTEGDVSYASNVNTWFDAISNLINMVNLIGLGDPVDMLEFSGQLADIIGNLNDFSEMLDDLSEEPEYK